MKRYLISLPLLLALSLTGCSMVDRYVYKLDIPQGNVVTADVAAKLKPGMNKNQVQFLLGTPLLADPFHAQRWDYVYRDSKGGVLAEQKRFVVHFDGDKLSRFGGETLPASRPSLSSDPTGTQP